MILGRRYRGASIVTGAVMLTAPVAALATGYEGQQFRPAHDGTGVFSAYGAEPLPLFETHVDLWMDHSRHPVVLRTGDDDFAMLVRSATSTEVGAMIGLPLDVEAGFALPYFSHDVVNPLGPDGKGGIATSGIGDLRLIGKWAAFRSTNEYMPIFGFLGELTVPTGDEQSWMGSGVATPLVALLAQQNVGPVGLVANIGYRLHPGDTEKVWGVDVGDQLQYKVGAAVNTGFQDIEVLGEVAGGSTIGGDGPTPLEVGAGLRRSVWGGVTAVAGVNRGISDSLGTPRWRFFGGLSWEWGRKDLRSVSAAPPPILAAEPAPTPAPTPVLPTVRLHPEPTPVAAAPAPTPTPAPVARVTETQIEINQTIHFRKNSAKIEETSFGILDQVVRQMKEHPEVTLVSIEGHTDSTGNALFNLYLSKVRANSVRKYLVKNGIEEDRLDTRGWGHERPMSDNRTKDGRALNRRVEFRIVKRK